MSALPEDRRISERARKAWARHLGSAPPDGLRERLAEGSIAATAHETALATPDRPAIAIDDERLTHGELDDQAGRMAAWLDRNGVGPGDVILISSPSSVAFAVAYLGVLRAGATALLANPAYTEPELEMLVSDSGTTLALAAGPGLERLTGVAERQPQLRAVRPLGAVRDEFDSLRAVEPAPRSLQTPAILAYTSGTTGRPKAVPLSDANLLASMRAVMMAWRWEPDDVLVHALPLFHQHGLGGLHAALLAGSSTIARSRFDPGDLCRVMAEARASVLFAVPAMYVRLAEWEGAPGAGLGRLRLLISGSAPLAPRLAERVAELAGQPPLERYGLTESGLDVSNLYDGPRRAGYVGLAVPGIELELADEQGEALPPGRDGEIVLRGPQVFGGYRGEAARAATAFHPGGWFRTGDLGRIDPADGYLQITGRLKELIISGGMNVYPREVEQVLEGHPGVSRVSVVGVPSERWGEAVAAAVVPAPGSSPGEEELLEFARGRLAPFKCPKQVLVLDELPVNALGKVLVSEVRKLF
jgi:malonyl-CoA/methylmalonyl-CoA synthetase